MSSALRNLILASLLAASFVPLAEAVDRCTVGLTCVEITWSRVSWDADKLTVDISAEHEAVGGVTGRLFVDGDEQDSCVDDDVCTTSVDDWEIPEGSCIAVYATSTPTAGAPISDSATICATNPSFEHEDDSAGADCPPVGWDHYVFGAAGQNVCRSTEAAHTGAASAKFVDTISGGSGSYAGLMTPTILISEGETAHARVWANVSGSGMFVYALWFDANGGDAGTTLLNTTSASGTWARYDNSATAPAGTASASLLIYSCTGCITTAYVDDAFIERA